MGADPCARGISELIHVIACIEDTIVIKNILVHINTKAVISERNGSRKAVHHHSVARSTDR